MTESIGTPLISVIVPVYNMEKYLMRCVDSIIRQTYTNIEIILVDDGSKDGSSAICDEYVQNYSRIKVIHKPNGGPDRKGDIKHSNADISKARELLGYDPEYDFARGLNEAIDWYRENL